MHQNVALLSAGILHASKRSTSFSWNSTYIKT
jgi:hypothetical protein